MDDETLGGFMEKFETLEIEFGQGYAIVRLNRPPVNAVNRAMRNELTACFTALSQNRDIGAVVLSATGDRAFCAGVDLKQRAADKAPTEDMDVRQVIDPAWEWRQTQYSIQNCTIPVIASFERAAIGAGFGLLGVCDLVIAGDKATIGLTEINVGLLGGASKALRLFGPSKARRMLFLGEMIDAQELYRLGGIEEVVPSGGAEARAVEIATELGKKSPIALRLAKESILRIERDDVMQSYRTENDYTNRLGGFNDSKEATRAFNEKRAAKWTWS
jgi:enoyl-CoA hydratase